MPAVESTMLPLGTPAPEFVLADPNGTAHDVPGSDAPAYVVAFVCNHCPYVVHIADQLGVVGAELEDMGVRMVAINSNDADAYPDDAPEAMGPMAERHGWTFPYLVDATQDAARAYRAACTPDLFVFDSRRRLVYRGQFDASRPSNDEAVTGGDLLAAVRAVLDGTDVPENQIPSLGCSIKWRPDTSAG
jgi:peroxiredoxin